MLEGLTFVTNMLVAKDLPELSAKTGIPEPSLKLLLNEIGVATARLLQVESSKSTIGEVSISPTTLTSIPEVTAATPNKAMQGTRRKRRAPDR